MLIPWPKLEDVIGSARLILLYGPPGTGKSTAAMRAGNPASVFALTLTDETPAAELRGHFIPKGSEFVWMDGPAMRAFRTGARLVLNEVDKASDDALDFLHCLLDDPGIAAIGLPTGETVYPGETFQVICTMNGQPEDLPDAVRDRLSVRVEVTVPHPDALARFPQAIQDAIIGTTPVDEDDRRTSMRAWANYLTLCPTVGEETAAACVFGARAAEVLSAIRLAGER